MSETTMRWDDAKAHRDPKWPIGGYAPGAYMAKCRECNAIFVNMDKRAMQCFPCAVETLQQSHDDLRQELRKVEAEKATLLEAINIKQPATAHSEKGEG